MNIPFYTEYLVNFDKKSRNIYWCYTPLATSLGYI